MFLYTEPGMVPWAVSNQQQQIPPQTRTQYTPIRTHRLLLPFIKQIVYNWYKLSNASTDLYT